MIRTQKRREAERGTTLIELVFGSVICLSVVSGVVAIVISNAGLRRADDELAVALRACRAKIEELRSLDFNDVPAQNGTGFAAGTDPSTIKLNPVPGDPDGLPGEVEVDVEESQSGETLYRATVSVVWSGVSKQRRYSVSCFLADRRRGK